MHDALDGILIATRHELITTILLHPRHVLHERRHVAFQQQLSHEIVEGDGPVVRKGDSVTVNYHGVVWGKDTPFDSSFNRHQPATFAIGVGQVIKGWDQTVTGHNVGSRLIISIPPEYGYGSRGVPQAGIGGGDTLVFVVDIISVN